MRNTIAKVTIENMATRQESRYCSVYGSEQNGTRKNF